MTELRPPHGHRRDCRCERLCPEPEGRSGHGQVDITGGDPLGRQLMMAAIRFESVSADFGCEDS